MTRSQPHTLPKRAALPRVPLHTMFEEEYERCFICEQPCKGLYCSSECRMQDRGVPEKAKGNASPVARAAGIRLTAQLPVSLSPLLRPTNHHAIGPSPRMPASNVDSSSSSSITSSPIQSPRTNPSGSDSPQKDSFDLPPPAYPNNTPSSLAFPHSTPVKIPALIPKSSPVQTPGSRTPASTASTVYPVGASIDTLRFGRKPGLTNSVTSPNALLPRCACGKPANHRDRRAMSKDRAFESGFTALSLGPSVTSAEPPQRTQRIVSDSAVSPSKAMLSGFTTPQHVTDNPNGSYLSRSRSDPIPPSPTLLHNTIVPMSRQESASRRASHAAADGMIPFRGATPANNIGPGGGAPSSISRNRGIIASGPGPNPISLAASPRRGRSRERTSHPLEQEVSALLNHPPDREHPPSRSRHRRDQRGERRRSDEERSRPRLHLAAVEPAQVPTNPPPITPSWSQSRQTSPTDLTEAPTGPAGTGVAPAMRRAGSSGGQRSPEAEASDPKQAEMQRASQQLGSIYGVAAG